MLWGLSGWGIKIEWSLFGRSKADREDSHGPAVDFFELLSVMQCF